ncbi:carbohydrate ABC transporter permease [Litorihabitans aurantiacus]|uniref:Sugar ABC transporter permease n=1 Tax=Litorihabitans aurantiacus TaxID=1930061 RepID=A0AA37XET5_9MICO|nr:carbohydrate ABC transporter permease [Litorihabitans aurantiacus]GMA31882.1 sugar ABC transporter permease [Litorihabitans aurantiacus]
MAALLTDPATTGPADAPDGVEPAPRSARAARRLTRQAENRAQTRLIVGDRRLARVAVLAVLAVLALAWLIPLLWAVVTSLKSEQAAASDASWFPADGFTPAAYVSVLTAGDVPLWMLNSTIVAVVVTAVTVMISAMAGYAISRTRFRGRRLLLALVLGSIMIPPQILIVPLFQEMLALGLVDTLAGVILPQLVAPVMVFILARFFDAVPQEILDAASVDGAGPWRVFWRIVLPLSRSILVAVAIFVFIGAWNNFLWPFIVTNDPALMTLPVGLATVKNAYGVQYAQTMASAILAALPLLVVFMMFQRRIVQGIATTGLGGQ